MASRAEIKKVVSRLVEQDADDPGTFRYTSAPTGRARVVLELEPHNTPANVKWVRRVAGYVTGIATNSNVLVFYDPATRTFLWEVFPIDEDEVIRLAQILFKPAGEAIRSVDDLKEIGVQFDRAEQYATFHFGGPQGVQEQDVDDVDYGDTAKHTILTDLDALEDPVGSTLTFHGFGWEEDSVANVATFKVDSSAEMYELCNILNRHGIDYDQHPRESVEEQDAAPIEPGQAVRFIDPKTGKETVGYFTKIQPPDSPSAGRAQVHIGGRTGPVRVVEPGQLRPHDVSSLKPGDKVELVGFPDYENPATVVASRPDGTVEVVTGSHRRMYAQPESLLPLGEDGSVEEQEADDVDFGGKLSGKTVRFVARGMLTDTPEYQREAEEGFSGAGFYGTKYVGTIVTLPGQGGEGGRQDAVFDLPIEHVGRFAAWRLTFEGIAWWGDYIVNDRDIIPPADRARFARRESVEEQEDEVDFGDADAVTRVGARVYFEYRGVKCPATVVKFTRVGAGMVDIQLEQDLAGPGYRRGDIVVISRDVLRLRESVEEQDVGDIDFGDATNYVILTDLDALENIEDVLRGRGYTWEEDSVANVATFKFDSGGEMWKLLNILNEFGIDYDQHPRESVEEQGPLSPDYRGGAAVTTPPGTEQATHSSCKFYAANPDREGWGKCSKFNRDVGGSEAACSSYESAAEESLSEQEDEIDFGPAKRGLEALPEMCFALLPPEGFGGEGAIIVIKKGEEGYHTTDYSGGQEMVDRLNARGGIPDEAVDVMIAGSMFGWNAKIVQNYQAESTELLVDWLVEQDEEHLLKKRDLVRKCAQIAAEESETGEFSVTDVEFILHRFRPKPEDWEKPELPVYVHSRSTLHALLNALVISGELRMRFSPGGGVGMHLFSLVEQDIGDVDYGKPRFEMTPTSLRVLHLIASGDGVMVSELFQGTTSRREDDRIDDAIQQLLRYKLIREEPAGTTSKFFATEAGREYRDDWFGDVVEQDAGDIDFGPDRNYVEVVERQLSNMSPGSSQQVAPHIFVKRSESIPVMYSVFWMKGDTSEYRDKLENVPLTDAASRIVQWVEEEETFTEQDSDDVDYGEPPGRMLDYAKQVERMLLNLAPGVVRFVAPSVLVRRHRPVAGVEVEPTYSVYLTPYRDKLENVPLVAAVARIVQWSEEQRETLYESEHFKVQRADDCIWLLDLRSDPPREIHMVPDQARLVAGLLDQAVSSEGVDAEVEQALVKVAEQEDEIDYGEPKPEEPEPLTQEPVAKITVDLARAVRLYYELPRRMPDQGWEWSEDSAAGIGTIYLFNQTCRDRAVQVLSDLGIEYQITESLTEGIPHGPWEDEPADQISVASEQEALRRLKSVMWSPERAKVAAEKSQGHTFFKVGDRVVGAYRPEEQLLCMYESLQEQDADDIDYGGEPGRGLTSRPAGTTWLRDMAPDTTVRLGSYEVLKRAGGTTARGYWLAHLPSGRGSGWLTLMNALDVLTGLIALDELPTVSANLYPQGMEMYRGEEPVAEQDIGDIDFGPAPSPEVPPLSPQSVAWQAQLDRLVAWMSDYDLWYELTADGECYLFYHAGDPGNVSPEESKERRVTPVFEVEQDMWNWAFEHKDEILQKRTELRAQGEEPVAEQDIGDVDFGPEPSYRVPPRGRTAAEEERLRRFVSWMSDYNIWIESEGDEWYMFYDITEISDLAYPQEESKERRVTPVFVSERDMWAWALAPEGKDEILQKRAEVRARLQDQGEEPDIPRGPEESVVTEQDFQDIDYGGERKPREEPGEYPIVGPAVQLEGPLWYIYCVSYGRYPGDVSRGGYRVHAPSPLKALIAAGTPEWRSWQLWLYATSIRDEHLDRFTDEDYGGATYPHPTVIASKASDDEIRDVVTRTAFGSFIGPDRAGIANEESEVGVARTAEGAIAMAAQMAPPGEAEVGWEGPEESLVEQDPEDVDYGPEYRRPPWSLLCPECGGTNVEIDRGESSVQGYPQGVPGWRVCRGCGYARHWTRFEPVDQRRADARPEVESLVEQDPGDVDFREREPRTPTMMKCGHAALAVDEQGHPVCPICYGITTDAEEVAEEPNLAERQAQCPTCKKVVPSSLELPFFEHRPEREYDSFYCGCRGWESKHLEGYLVLTEQAPEDIDMGTPPRKDKDPTLRFTDGEEIDTRGPLRSLELYDGWYVVGLGMLIPVDSKEAAEETMADIRRRRGESVTEQEDERVTEALDTVEVIISAKSATQAEIELPGMKPINCELERLQNWVEDNWGRGSEVTPQRSITLDVDISLLYDFLSGPGVDVNDYVTDPVPGRRIRGSDDLSHYFASLKAVKPGEAPPEGEEEEEPVLRADRAVPREDQSEFAMREEDEEWVVVSDNKRFQSSPLTKDAAVRLKQKLESGGVQAKIVHATKLTKAEQ